MRSGDKGPYVQVAVATGAVFASSLLLATQLPWPEDWRSSPVFLFLWVCAALASTFFVTWRISRRAVTARREAILALIAEADRWIGEADEDRQNYLRRRGLTDLDARRTTLERAVACLGDLIRSMTEALREANLSLRQQNHRLAGFFQSMSDGLIAVDRDSRVVLLTDRARALLGREIRKEVYLPLFGQNYARLEALVRDPKAGDVPRQFEFATRYPEERRLMVTVTRLSESEEGSLLMVIQDQTRLKRLEELRQEFVANVTHELKTPLTSIEGYIELLQSAPRDEATRQAFYEIIGIEAKRLMNLIQDLLQLAELERRQNGERLSAGQETELAPCVRAVLRVCQPLADEHGVRLKDEIPNGFRAPGTAEQLRQILMNLVSNAIRYNRKEGEVLVTAGSGVTADWILVRDTGIGIAEAEQPRIFERFYRADKARSRATGGTGLGLSIVKHLAALLNMRIELKSALGQGTEIALFFAPPEHAASPAAVDPEHAPDGREAADGGFSPSPSVQK